MKEFNIKLNWAEKITPHVMHLAFEREDGLPFTFVPGQFVTFLFETSSGIKRRSYSIASIPGKTREIEIAISYLKNGIASEILFHLPIGQTMTCSGPFGRLVLREDEIPKRYILVATGTGVAPYRAMLPQMSHLLVKNPHMRIHLLLGVQYRTDLLYANDFIEFSAQEPRFHFQAFLSRDELKDPKSYESRGYVQDGFTSLDLEPDTDLLYLCGNPNMIDQAFGQLTDMGFSPKAVRREKYLSSN